MRSRSTKLVESFQRNWAFFEALVDFKHELAPVLSVDEDSGIGGGDFFVVRSGSMVKLAYQIRYLGTQEQEKVLTQLR